jgi:restriction endonuclease S subunit
MSVRAPVGPVNLCPEEICIGRGLAAIRPKEMLLRDYLFYFLRANQDRIRGADGAVFPSISRDQIADLEIPLPALEEQRRIVEEVEGYQKVLDGARQILEAYSPRFAIDPSWPSARLGDVCETSSGGTPLTTRRDYYHGGTIPWLKSGEVAKGYIYQVDEFITELGLRNSSAKLFPTDTVLVAMYGATAGQVGLLKVPSTTNQAVCGVLPNERILPEFLYYQLRARTEEMKSLAGGGAQPNISQQIIRSLEIVLPPLSEQQRLVAELTAEAEQMGAVRSVLPVFQAKIVAVLNRVWKHC